MIFCFLCKHHKYCGCGKRSRMIITDRTLSRSKERDPCVLSPTPLTSSKILPSAGSYRHPAQWRTQKTRLKLEAPLQKCYKFHSIVLLSSFRISCSGEESAFGPLFGTLRREPHSGSLTIATELSRAVE